MIWPWQKANRQTTEAVTRVLSGEKTEEEELQDAIKKLQLSVDSLQKAACYAAVLGLVTIMRKHQRKWKV